VLIEPGTPDATCQALRTVRARAPELPVVVLTRIGDPDTAARLLRLGAQDCLVKTRTDGHALSRAIRFAVVRHRLLAAQRRHAAHDLQLFAIGLALQTTQQRSAGQPDLADRINDHLNALHQVVQLVRSAIVDSELTQ
jgi:DNA-binding NarL/FixJ family response regulator